jgi:predicted PurR-regulated permease PerM
MGGQGAALPLQRRAAGGERQRRIVDHAAGTRLAQFLRQAKRGCPPGRSGQAAGESAMSRGRRDREGDMSAASGGRAPLPAGGGAPDTAAESAWSEARLRRLLTLFLTILAGAGVLWVIWQIVGHVGHALVVALLSALLAFVLAAPVERLEARGLPRAAAVGVVYASALVCLAAGLTLLIGPLANQVGGLVDAVPRQLQALQEQLAALEQNLSSRNLPVRLVGLQQQALARAEGAAMALIEASPAFLAGLAGALVDLIVVVVLGFYLLLDGPRLRHQLLRLAPPRSRGWIFVVEAAFRNVVGSYLRGQLLVAFLIGLSAGVGSWLLGAPFPVVIGVLSGLLELVPMLGPILATIVAVLITLPQGFPQVLWVLLLFIGIHQVEINILAPRIAGHAVGLHPAAALLALLAGFEVGGVLGALVAVPVAGILYVLAWAIYWEWSGRPAREPVRRRRWWDRRDAPPVAPVATVTATSVAVQGAPTEQPEALASLAEQAQKLSAEFEQMERAREAGQSAPVAPGADQPRAERQAD